VWTLDPSGTATELEFSIGDTFSVDSHLPNMRIGGIRSVTQGETEHVERVV